MLAVLLLAQVARTYSVDDLCMMQCGARVDLPKDICSADRCDRLDGNCCWSNGKIQIDLRNCSIDELPANIFLEDPRLLNETSVVERICLDHNGISGRNVSVDAFRGLTGLQITTLPSAFDECLGGNKYWDTHTYTQDKTTLICRGQKQPCNVSGEVCSEKSHCVDDGPGRMRCRCNEGFYGYKCLRSGTFPYATFYGSLAAGTLFISAVLWFVGRRQIGAHTKQS